MKTGPHIRVVRLAGFTLITLAGMSAADFEITRSTIDGGGVIRSTGGAFELSGTIGQPDAGVMSSGPFELTGGFWFALDPGDCNEDGVVGLSDFGAFESCLSGPAAPPGGGCNCHDLDGNGTVDLADFAYLQVLHTGN